MDKDSLPYLPDLRSRKTLVDPEASYLQSLREFREYTKKLGLVDRWWEQHDMWEWYGLPYLPIEESTELVRLNFLCRCIESFIEGREHKDDPEDELSRDSEE